MTQDKSLALKTLGCLTTPRNVLPSHLRLTEILCLTATLQRAGAYGALYFSEQTAENLNPWGNFFYRTRGQEYRRDLRWAEETFAR